MNQYISGMLNAIRSFVPEISITYKQNAKIMHLLNKVVRFWCPTFMTKYTTTFGFTIYSAREPEYLNYTWLPVLAHEAVHLWHRKRAPLLFDIAYIMPQALAVLAPFGLLGLAYKPLFFLFLFALMLLPIPAYFRFYTEFHAYSMSMAMNYWMYNDMTEPSLDHFTGRAYYWMWPFKKHLEKKFEEQKQHILNNTFTVDKPLYKAIYLYLRDSGLLHK